MSRRRRILLWAAVVLVAAILLPVLWHYQLKAAVDRYRAELKARGEPMELVQALPPAVPPQEDGTGFFLKAAALLHTNRTVLDSNRPPSMRMVAPGKAMVGWKQADVRDPGRHGSTNSWDEIAAAVAQDAAAIASLRESISRPKFDFHIAYEKGFADSSFFTNLHLVESKRFSQLLSSSAALNLHGGRTGEAVKDIQATLVLSENLHRERIAISELVGIAVAAIAQGATWDVLQSTNVTDGELAALQQHWGRVNYWSSHMDALTMERLCGDAMLKQWRSSQAEMLKSLGIGAEVRNVMGLQAEEEPSVISKAKLSAQLFLWRYWWSYTDELRSQRGLAVLRDTIRFAQTNGSCVAALKQQNVELDALGIGQLENSLEGALSSKGPNFHSLLSESVVSEGQIFRRVFIAETMSRMTATAIALKRFHLRRGHYPAQLAELTPELLPSVPLDPADGQPLSYRLESDGTFRLYSIGEDGVDDRGDARPAKGQSLYWQYGHDWVWPQPATAAESEAWEALQSKSK
jgi:hypothetical protein